ncbi:hypothetical protein DPMN_148419 [Dreissena polymorpha]|uniref:Uncharacterized protein n=1 Tax=Dreissena polymorpha TaxID=45954 RepID=A0A9D4FBQ1_DREPO|nr:hypothetical protein DPMN_148419 [Dreissena polymorpha]
MVLEKCNAYLEHRYTDTSFFGTDRMSNAILYIGNNTPSKQLTCLDRPQCGIRRCVAYTKDRASCNNTPFLQVIANVDYSLQASISKGIVECFLIIFKKRAKNADCHFG